MEIMKSRTGLLLVSLLAGLGSCRSEKPSGSESLPHGNWTSEVEVAPGEWLALEGEEGRAWFKCQWKGKTAYGPGERRHSDLGDYDSQLPVCLRSFGGDLYLIYNEKLVPDGQRFAYARLSSSGTRFEALAGERFPRQIATQNIGLNLEGLAYYDDGVRVDWIKMLKNLEVTDPFFPNSTTGRIWYELETGDRYGGMKDGPVKAAEFCEHFVGKYHPVPLPTLVRSN